ncbi:MAG: molybdopterin converting factor small subunit [Verrucomicrobiales bacterium]|jgi:molybdopterin converting factor small subunit
MNSSNNEANEPSMKVLFFSVLQDAAGGEKQIDWPLTGESLTVAELMLEIYDRWPDLKQWDAQIRVAVDLEYVERSHVIRGGDEIALMPPVQGG